jgi:Holliday junction resolvase
MTNAKKKGNIWENKLANWLRSHGFKAHKDPSSGSHYERGDIVNDMNFTIESKAGKKVMLQEWWKQVEYSASQQKNEPVLFIHIDGMPDNNWLVVMNSEDWIERMKGNGNTAPTYEDPKLKYAMLRLKDNLREVIKYIDL